MLGFLGPYSFAHRAPLQHLCTQSTSATPAHRAPLQHLHTEHLCNTCTQSTSATPLHTEHLCNTPAAAKRSCTWIQLVPSHMTTPCSPLPQRERTKSTPLWSQPHPRTPHTCCAATQRARPPLHTRCTATQCPLCSPCACAASLCSAPCILPAHAPHHYAAPPAPQPSAQQEGPHAAAGASPALGSLKAPLHEGGDVAQPKAGVHSQGVARVQPLGLHAARAQRQVHGMYAVQHCMLHHNAPALP